jgi:hypothetical protein
LNPTINEVDFDDVADSLALASPTASPSPGLALLDDIDYVRNCEKEPHIIA